MIRKFEIALIIFCLGLGVSLSTAQEYDVMPMNEQFDLQKIKDEPEANGELKRAGSIRQQRISKENQNASTVFRTGQINARFQGYYKQVIVPELTLYDEASLAQLPAKHQKIIKDFGTRIRAPEVHVYLVTEVFFPMMSQIVEGNYHPAVRYNAMLTIGKLDEVIGKQRTSAPRPYRKSLPFLIEKYNEFNDPKLAYLKYGAFKGIARIAAIEFQKPDSTAAAAKPVLTALIGAKPAGLDDALFSSMQKTSVQVLGILGDPANIDAFVSLVQDPKASIWTRTEAAVAISKAKTNTMDATKLDTAATGIAKFMHDVLREEVRSMTETQKRIAILAARKAELVAGPAKSFGGKGKSGKKGGGDRSGLASGGGGGSGVGTAPGDEGGGSMTGGMTGGGSSGRAMSGQKGSGKMDDLPSYRIQVARRRIKTVALGLLAAFGDPNGSTGMQRWSKGNASLAPKLQKFKEHMKAADKAAELGLTNESGPIDSMTDAMRAEFTKVADSIAQTLGVPAPAKGDATAKGKKAKGKAGDSFLNN